VGKWWTGLTSGAVLSLLAACQKQTPAQPVADGVRFDVQVPTLQDRVRVELKPINNPVEQSHELRAQTDWARVQDLPAWQLRQYRSRRDDGAWGYVSYDAYRLDAHTQVWYFFHHQWMAQWAQIHAQVVKAVDQTRGGIHAES
jgi:hypothetical protein